MKKKYRYYISFIVVALIIGMGFGYSKLMATLSIDANVNVSSVRWNIECKNISVKEGSFTNNDTNYVRIDPENPNKISYNVTLNSPGDFYEFTFKIANTGTLRGKLDNIVSTGTSDTDIIDTEYIDYSVNLPTRGSTLSPNGELIVKIRLEYLPGLGGTESYNVTKNYEFNYVRY